MIILKRKTIGIVAAICILVITAVIFINNIKPSSTAEDIEVEGFLQLNKTGEINYKDYMLNINMIKKKDCQVIVYPYLKELERSPSMKKKRMVFIYPVPLEVMVLQNLWQSMS